jgi:hypothetical protein
MSTTFTPDPELSDLAESLAVDALEIAKTDFDATLDWSEESVKTVESILAELHDEFAEERPDEETLTAYAERFGSYVGEVLRRHHGGEWGLVKMEGNEFPGVANQQFGLSWPWMQVHRRLTEGEEFDVAGYYKRLTSGE